MFRRKMAFAGSWYPANPDRCEARIRDWLLRPLPGGAVSSWLGVVPHAGWTFSGALAARVFQALPADPDVELAIVMGGHLGASDPVVAMTEGSWETPLGALPIFGGLRSSLGTLPNVIFEDAHRHFEDNSTELQLPFVKFRWPDAQLLPLRVPPGSQALAVGRLLAEFIAASGIRTVVIASTDLTHYGPAYGFEPEGSGGKALHWVRGENDRTFIEAMASGDSEEILRVAAQRRNACSPGAVAALNEIGRGEKAIFHLLDYATSQDVRPHDAENFVGYASGIFGAAAGG